MLTGLASGPWKSDRSCTQPERRSCFSQRYFKASQKQGDRIEYSCEGTPNPSQASREMRGERTLGLLLCREQAK
jgi:hypothetical protein